MIRVTRNGRTWSIERAAACQPFGGWRCYETIGLCASEREAIARGLALALKPDAP